jgi:Cof subfamily protein (haloacid dehalogenase superfamily)
VRFRLVASDVDGTLLRSDETLSIRNRAAIDAVVERSLFVIATGRPPRWTHPIAEMVDHHGIAVCSNGAVIMDLSDESIIDTQLLSPSDAAAAAEAIRSVLPDVGFAVDSLDGLGHEPPYVPAFDSGRQVRIAPLEELIATPSLKLLFRHAGMTEDILAAIAEAVGKHGTITYGSIGSTAPARTLIEVMARGVSKAAALQRICDMRGISAADTIAFGDMPNDIEMLAWAGHGVAMGNGHPETKAVADEVTLTNDEDGVGVVLERELARG